MAKPKVYSYSRFSDPRQATGHSAERQAEYAARWAAEQGLELDESLTLRDEGLSAYHQHHIKRGALGVFLRAAEDGLIPVGSYLIVEGLDRLSRAEPIQAQAQLSQIITAGITVVTASDGKVYNRERLREQPMDLVYSLLVMVRANEESETKSKRVTAAIRRQCEGWMAGTYRGVIRNGKDPSWVQWNGEKFEPIPHRVEGVRLALQLYLEGYGGSRIVREMEKHGLSFTTLGINYQQIYRIVKMRPLIGEKVIEVGGVEYRLPNYYPPILTDEEFGKLQAYVDRRFVRKGKEELPSIVTGLNGITRCGYCGCTMNTSNSGAMVNRKGHSIQAHRRVVCSGSRTVEGCRFGYSSSVVPIENAIMDFCSDQMNLDSLIHGDTRSSPTLAKIQALRERMAETERQVSRLTAVMLADDDAPPKALLQKARELDKKLSSDRAELDAASHELVAMGGTKSPALATAWQDARDGAKALDEAARLRVRRLVGETFSKMVLYLRGADPMNQDGETVDLVLVSKSGNTRSLRIHRFTGEWKSMEDYRVPEEWRVTEAA